MAPLLLLTHQTCFFFLFFATYIPFFFLFHEIFVSCLWSFSQPDAVGNGIVLIYGLFSLGLTIAREMVKKGHGGWHVTIHVRLPKSLFFIHFFWWWCCKSRCYHHKNSAFFLGLAYKSFSAHLLFPTQNRRSSSKEEPFEMALTQWWVSRSSSSLYRSLL